MTPCGQDLRVLAIVCVDLRSLRSLFFFHRLATKRKKLTQVKRPITSMTAREFGDQTCEYLRRRRVSRDEILHDSILAAFYARHF